MNATSAVMHGGIALIAGAGAGLASFGLINGMERHPDDTGLALATNVAIPLTTAATFGVLMSSVGRGSTLGAAGSGAALLGTLAGGIASAYA